MSLPNLPFALLQQPYPSLDLVSSYQIYFS